MCRPVSGAATQATDYKKMVSSADTCEGHSVCRDIYHRGSVAYVVLIQESPGIGQKTFALTDRLISAGSDVVVPHPSGPIGKTLIIVGSIVSNVTRVICLRREFNLFAGDKPRPVVD